MAKTITLFETKLLKLPVKERAKLAELLIRSLDSVDYRENERLWIQETERRYKAYKKGKVIAKPASEVLATAYKTIK